MCVMFLHYISDERPTKTTRYQVTTQSNISVSKFALLNSLEHEVSLLFHLKGLHFIIKLTS